MVVVDSGGLGRWGLFFTPTLSPQLPTRRRACEQVTPNLG